MVTNNYSNVWYYWTTTDSGSSTATCSASAGDYVWESWNTSTTSTAASTGDATWKVWTVNRPYSNLPHQQQEMVDWSRINRVEQARRAAVEAAAEAQEKRYAEIQRKRDDAEKKAQQLLLDLIGDEQLKIYNETGRLFVRGNQHDYILKRGGLVTQVSKDKVVDMCVHLAERSSFPETDNVVGLKLMLESEDERKVLKLANYHTYSERLRESVKLPIAACM